MREKVWILKIKCEVGTRGSVTPTTVELSEMCEIRGSTTAKELQTECMYVCYDGTTIDTVYTFIQSVFFIKFINVFLFLLYLMRKIREQLLSTQHSKCQN